MTEEVRILVTAIGGGGHGDQILKALQLADRNEYRIFGADINPRCHQAALVEEFIRLPPATDPRYMKELLAACERLGVNALFHGCEPELKAFARSRAEIEARGIFLPINSNELIALCMDKSATNARLAELGFEAPRFARIETREHLSGIDWFPVVVKPSTGGGGSSNVMIAQDTRELMALAEYLGLGTTAKDFMIQEYVGLPHDEYTVGVLHGGEGQYINSIAVRRHLSGGLSVRAAVPNRTGRTDLGPKLVISSGVSQGDVGRHEEVTAQCKTIAAKIGAKGPLNIQCRLVDGAVKVFEINPRFSGTTSLRAMVGFNEPDILLRRHFFNERVSPDFAYRQATVVRGLSEYLMPSDA